jgi:hypothetical protein
LKNGEKQKSHFLFFDSEQVMDDLFRAFLNWGTIPAKNEGFIKVTDMKLFIADKRLLMKGLNF